MHRILMIFLYLWPAWASAQMVPRPAPAPRAILRPAPLPPSVGARWRVQQQRNAVSPLGMWSPPDGYAPPPVRLAPPPQQTSIGRPGEAPPPQRGLVQDPGRPFSPDEVRELVRRFPGNAPTFAAAPVTGGARPLRELVSGVTPTGPDGVRPCPGGVGCRNITVQRFQASQGHRSAAVTIGACRLGLACQSSHTTVGLRAASGNARSSAEATIGPDAGYAIGQGGSGNISAGRRALLEAAVNHATTTTAGVPPAIGNALRGTMREAHAHGAPDVVQNAIFQRRKP